MGLNHQGFASKIVKQIRVHGCPFINDLRKIVKNLRRKKRTWNRMVSPFNCYAPVKLGFIGIILKTSPALTPPDIYTAAMTDGLQ